VFNKYDVNRDGKIEINEFKRVLKEANYHLEEDIPSEVLDEILERADWDVNKHITYNEFIRMVSVY